MELFQLDIISKTWIVRNMDMINMLIKYDYVENMETLCLDRRKRNIFEIWMQEMWQDEIRSEYGNIFTFGRNKVFTKK